MDEKTEVALDAIIAEAARCYKIMGCDIATTEARGHGYPLIWDTARQALADVW